jgi:hypothetical protein
VLQKCSPCFAEAAVRITNPLCLNKLCRDPFRVCDCTWRVSALVAFAALDALYVMEHSALNPYKFRRRRIFFQISGDALKPCLQYVSWIAPPFVGKEIPRRLSR